MSKLVETIDHLGEQVRHAYDGAKQVPLPASYASVSHVVLVGMGGSELGADIVRTALASKLTIPLEVVSGYRLPATATADALVILSSFSGTTEEVLNAYKEAKKLGRKLFVITSGGTLAAWAERDKTPAYYFDPTGFAPQPRYGTGYMVMGIVGALMAIGKLSVSETEVKSISHRLGQFQATKKRAATIARALVDRMPIIVASEHLEGAAHVVTNSVNESAKHFSARFALPELNHHLMEGLTFPKEQIKAMTFVFVESSLYHPRVKKRYPLTEQVVKKNGAKSLRIAVEGKTPLEQAFALIQLGGYVTAEMARIKKVNPEAIPWVDWFKAQMQK